MSNFDIDPIKYLHEFKRIGCGLCWLSLESFPERWIIILPRCLPAENCLHAPALHAVALGPVSLDERRELRLERVLCGIDFAEGAGEFLLLQLVLNGQHELREPLEIRARMELHLFEP